MAKLIYASNVSLDGWTEDADGGFNWAPPDDDVFASITEVMASCGTYLYGRRMYEVLAPWENDPALAEGSKLRAAYAEVWTAAEKVVYSSTLRQPITQRTRIERGFDAEAVRALRHGAERDLLIGGPHLAGQALDSRLVDEVVFYVWPIVLGAGRNAALQGTTRLDLRLVGEKRFSNGVLRLHYEVAEAPRMDG